VSATEPVIQSSMAVIEPVVEPDNRQSFETRFDDDNQNDPQSSSCDNALLCPSAHIIASAVIVVSSLYVQLYQQSSYERKKVLSLLL
jgi:hypothetical protein